MIVVDRAPDDHFRVTYADGTAFVIDPSASEVYGVPGEALTLDDAIVYLQGPILGFVLRLRGVTCLHASAVSDDGRAFAIVGDGGMGKSTSAAAFARLGLAVLTDDVLALDDRGKTFAVQPGLPRVMLWPESVAALWGDADALPRVVSTWEKRYLDLNQPGYRFAAEAQPLRAIYLLGERRPSAEQAEIFPLTGTEALIRLVANTYGNDLLDIAQRASELEVLGRLVSHVPVRVVHAPDDRSAITSTCEAMLADFRQLGAL